eukprot:SAG11_NODE_33961_length_274_cov_1.154286_1_plen_24_part_01
MHDSAFHRWETKEAKTWRVNDDFC